MTDNGALQYKDYAGGIEYRSTPTKALALESFYHAEGRVFNTNVAAATTTEILRYEYAVKDHLGNARLTFTDKNGNGLVDQTNLGSTNEIIQESHYYPFGLDLPGSWINDGGALDNLYKYNGKELNGDFGLGWMDYGARWYDGSVGRWWSVDPMGEKYTNWSQYNFVKNNPLRLVDPNGMAPDDYVYLDTKGREIGRVASDKVKQVTIIKDENIVKFHMLSEASKDHESSIAAAAKMGTSYEMNGILSLYNKSSKDIASPYQDGTLKIVDGKTGKPRYDLANEHGGFLKETNGMVSVGETWQGTPFNQAPPRNNTADEVSIVHTHPNEGKGEAVAVFAGARYPFKDQGPSRSIDLGSGSQPKQGYYNIVVDKSNVYFFSGKGSDAKTISISKSNL